jgi:hypothetical protein
MWGIVGGKEAVKMNQNERHLTGVGFEVKEAVACYGKETKRK